jgi:predicted nucleic acid-binding protein
LIGFSTVASIRRLYWDSCAFLGLINNEAGKHPDCRAVWAEVERGEAEIITSFFTFAEVFKAKCEGPAKPLDEDGEDKIAGFFASERILPVTVDRRTAELARRLMRRHPECKKPTDAVHLASAILLNVDEMHTYDGSDLLKLNKLVARQDGEMLTICTPYVPEPELLLEAKKDGPGEEPAA